MTPYITDIRAQLDAEAAAGSSAIFGSKTQTGSILTTSGDNEAKIRIPMQGNHEIPLDFVGPAGYLSRTHMQLSCGKSRFDPQFSFFFPIDLFTLSALQTSERHWIASCCSARAA
jgi:hypothetical protein